MDTENAGGVFNQTLGRIGSWGRFQTSKKYITDQCFQWKDIPYAHNYNPRLVIPRFAYFYPIFEDHFFVFKEVFSQNSVLMYAYYSRVVSNQERVMMARVQCVSSCIPIRRFEQKCLGCFYLIQAVNYWLHLIHLSKIDKSDPMNLIQWIWSLLFKIHLERMNACW